MRANKHGASELTTIIAVIAIALVAAYVFNLGGFQNTVSGWMKSSGSTGTDENINLISKDCPSDGTTTLTLYTPDKLATTATNVVTEYYIFDGNSLATSGTNTGESATITLGCGKDYKGIALNTTAYSGSSTGAYASYFDVKARTTKQSQTVPMIQIGGAKILSIENPSDPSRIANMSFTTAGAVKSFDIKFAANVSAKGYANPMILCQVNVTSVQSLSIGSFSDGTPVTTATLPKRVTPKSGYQYYGWVYGKILEPSMGVIAASGTITASSTAPGATDYLSCLLVDQATWKAANFKSLPLTDGFKTGTENTETSAEIGGPDSVNMSISFNNGGGY